jgi:hypothetical protein
MIKKILIKTANGIGLMFSILIRLLGLKKRVMQFLLDDVDKLLLQHRQEGFFVESGWMRSIEINSTVDAVNNPIPWVTYSFIEFIKKRLNHLLTIFEYGSGNSTLFYANKTAGVTVVEHDKDWYERLKSLIPSNVTLLYNELDYNGIYCRAVKRTGKKYDIIIVDGRDRVNCIKNSLTALKKNGVIILDDSERDAYQDGIKFLIKQKFKTIEFWGFSPGLFYNKCTTIFYRSGNCIGI